MRLSDFYLQFRRQRSLSQAQPKEQAANAPRQTLTLEAMTRAAQTKSLKAAPRQR